MKVKLFCCTDCAVVEGWKVIKKSVAVQRDFPSIYTILKSEELIINHIFDGLSYNTRRNLAHCS